ncbi:MAG: sugar-binding protein [Bacteroidales bacterium]|nr:sugar-binding protein [Bacteroidales bacterium]
MKKFIILSISTLALLVTACNKPEPAPEEPEGPQGAYKTEFRFSEAKKVFGFFSGAQYSYCPSIIDNGDGTCHIWFCGNPTKYKFVDNVFHVLATDGVAYTSATSVLQPTPNTWDKVHTCDPSVIKGEFKMNGKTYTYAMFYLGIDTGDCLGNEIGVAFSNDPDATSWDKYPSALIDFPGEEHSKFWGVGQPSAISLDKKGKVLLTYTRGYSGGTSLIYREVDMSDMSDIKMGEIKTIPGAQGVSCMRNADFAVDEANNKILAVIEGNSSSTYPTFIASSVSVHYADFDAFLAGTCKWKTYGTITSAVSGFPRNHNAGFRRDAYGYIPNYKEFQVYFTVSKAAPDVSSSNCAEWTYNIYRTTGSYVKVPIE